VGRDRNQVQSRLLRKAIHDPVKAPNQLIRDGETASALLDSRRSGRICRQRPSRASGVDHEAKPELGFRRSPYVRSHSHRRCALPLVPGRVSGPCGVAIIEHGIRA
jgi:hypothetical protein